MRVTVPDVVVSGEVTVKVGRQVVTATLDGGRARLASPAWSPVSTGPGLVRRQRGDPAGEGVDHGARAALTRRPGNADAVRRLTLA